MWIPRWTPVSVSLPSMRLPAAPWILLAFTLACAPPPPEVADLVIRDVRVVVGDGSVIDNATVIVVEGRLAAVGEDTGVWVGTQEIDGRGKTVMPGLIDSHVHLLVLASESAESVADFRAERLPGILSQYLEHGITTVRSTGDPLIEILEVREELRSGALRGPRLLTSGPVLTAVDGHPAATVCEAFFESPDWCRENLTRELPDPEAAREAVLELAEKGVDFIKVTYESEEGAKLELPILKAIVAEAGSRNLEVVVHSTPARLAAEAIEAGVDGLVHVPFQAAEFQTVVESLGEHPISATAGQYQPYEDPEGNLRTPYLPWWNDQLETTHRGILERVATLWKSGSPLAFGTDTPMFEPGQSWLHEIGALLDAGLTPADVLVMATRNAALALDIDAELGTLEEGKRADLVVVDGKPDVDLGALQNIRLVVKDGNVVVDRR